MPDQVLADALHRKYYSDMEPEDFYSRVGLNVEPEGFVESVKSDIKKRNENINKIQAREAQGEINPIRSGVRQAGQTAAAYTDVLGEAFSAIVPDFVEEPAGKILSNTVRAFGKLPSASGRTIGEDLPAELLTLKEKYPEVAEDIEAAFNIGVLAAPVKGRVKAGKTKIGSAGDSLIKMGDSQAQKKRNQFIEELVRPKQTPSVKEAQVARTTEGGFLNNKIIQPSKREAEIASEIAKIKSIGKHKTLQGNYNVLQSEVGKEADNLKAMLVANDVFFPRKEIRAALKNVSANLNKSPLITGDAATSAQRILEKMDELIDDMPKSSASNLLDARKKLDQWAKKQKGEAIFDPAGRDTAMSIALREIRQATNDFIDTKATNVPVKTSLRRQSNLYGAMENLAPKAADEAPNAISRLLQNTAKHVPLKNEFTQTIAAILGAGGAGFAVASSPILGKAALGGAAVYGAGKAVTSPQAKKALGQLLRATDKTIRVTKNKAALQQLRADRAILLEMIKSVPSASGQSQTTTQAPDQAQIRQ